MGVEQGLVMGVGLLSYGVCTGGLNEVGLDLGVGKEEGWCWWLDPVGWRDLGGVPVPKRGGTGLGCTGSFCCKKLSAVVAGWDGSGRGRRGVWLRCL